MQRALVCACAQAILAAYPLHYYDELVPLQQKWLVFNQMPWRARVDDITDYFGEKVGCCPSKP